MGAPKQTGRAASPDLTPDLAATHDPLDDAVTLVGYVGEGASAASVRLYDSLAFNRWLEIPVEAIIARVPAVGGGVDPAAGQSIVRLRRDATLVACRTVRASSHDGPTEPDDDDIVYFRYPRP